MADNTTFIVGGDPDGIKNAFSAMPPWATQETADEIAEWLKRSYGVQAKLLAQAIKCCGGAAATAADTAKVVDEMGKAARDLKKAAEANKQKQKTDDKKKGPDKDNTGNLLDTVGKKLNYVMTGFAAAGTKITGVVTDYMDVYDSLYKSGINVLNGNNTTTDGLVALNQAVNQTGLRLQVLQEISEKYSTAMNAVGFNKFTKAVSASSSKLELLGFSAKEGAELIAALMEAESGFSDIRGKSANDIATDALKMGAQFDKLSKTMGISRQQMIDNLKTTAKSSDSTLVAAKWGADAAKNVAAATAGIKDTNVREALTKMAAAADPVFTQVYKDLQASGQGALADQVATVAKSLRTVDPKEIPKIMEQLGANISDSSVSALADQVAAGNASAQAALELITALKQQSYAVSQASQVQQDAATNTERAIAAYQTQIERALAIPQAMFVPLVSQIDAVTDALRKLNDVVYKVTGSMDAQDKGLLTAAGVIGGFIASMVLAGPAITRFLSLFGTAGTVLSSTATLGARLLALTGMGAAGAIGGAIGYGAGTLIKDKLEESESGRDFLDKVGGTITEILANFGNKEAQEARDSMDRARSGLTDTTPKRISVPTTPAPSTINSPSAVSAPQPVPTTTQGNLPEDGSRSGGPAIPKPPANADINNLLSYQNSTLERILLSMNDLVSVNKDIRQFVRIQQ